MEQLHDLNSLNIFMHVAEHRSMTAAAKVLKVQKSTVSRNLKTLEDSIGNQLFYRTTRQIKLTDAGEELFNLCRRPHQDLLEHLSNQSLQSSAIEGTIRMSALEDIAEYILPPILSDFMQRYPKVKIKLDLNLQQVDLLKNQIDLVVRVGRINQTSLSQRKVGSIRFVFVATPRYLYTKGGVSDVEELKRHAILGLNTFAWDDKPIIFKNKDKQTQILLDSSFESNSVACLLSMVRKDQGIGLLPDFVVKPFLHRGELVQVAEDFATPPKPVRVATLAKRKCAPLVNEFMKHLGDSLEQTFRAT